MVINLHERAWAAYSDVLPFPIDDATPPLYFSRIVDVRFLATDGPDGTPSLLNKCNLVHNIHHVFVTGGSYMTLFAF